MIEPLLDYNGNIAGDIAVAVLITLAAAASCWNLAIRGHSTGSWLVTIGFSMHSLRMWATLIAGGDPPISPIGLICLAMISVGWCLIAFRSRHAAKCLDSPDRPLAGSAG